MNIYTFKKNLLCALLASVAFIALSTHAVEKTDTYFIPGFITEQGIAMPTLKSGTLVTKITGKLGGALIEKPVDFIALKIGYNLFIAQAVSANYQRLQGVFFKIYDNKIVATQARYCDLKYCPGRALQITDHHQTVSTGQNTNGYGIFDITLTATPAFAIAKSSNTRHYAVPGFVGHTPTQILGMPLPFDITTEANLKVKGKLGGNAIGTAINFTAKKVIRGYNSVFLAQANSGKYKKGVFFIIDGVGKISILSARYCPLSTCRHRDLAESDTHMDISTSQPQYGYGVFDINIEVTPYNSVAIEYVRRYSFPGFVTTQSSLIPNIILPLNLADATVAVTGQFGGVSVVTPVDFTAIKLGGNSFLAQIVTSEYKKGVFFTIQDDGKMKVTQARYCFLTDCQKRNVLLTDKQQAIAESITQEGYGIFDLTIAFLHDLPGFSDLSTGRLADESSVYNSSGSLTPASRAVDGSTNGNWNTYSIASTSKEQDAWWRIDLGRVKLVKQIRIYNRTDCCMDRLTNYRISISNDINFKTTTYQEDFHTYPNPEQELDFSFLKQRVQGRYIKIQLLENNLLSLAEVKVLGYDISVVPND